MLYPLPPPIGDIIPNLPGRLVTGGGETYPFRLSLELSKSGHNVTFFTGKLKGIKYNHLQINDNFRIIYLPILFGMHVQSIVSPKLLYYLLSGNFDVIHANQLPTAFSLIGSVAAKLKGKKLIITHHGFLPNLNIKAKILSLIMSKFVDAITVQSEYTANFYKPFVNEKKIRILPNGIDTHFYSPKKLNTDFIQRFKRDNEQIVLYVGRLLPSKGIDTLVSSISILSNKLNVKLIIVGEGPFREYIENLVKKLNLTDRVILTGFIKDEDLPYYYTLADVLVLPSVYYDCFGGYNAEPEAFGLVLAEAMACGTPTIATKVGGIPYWIKDNLNGLLFSPGNAEELSKSIYNLLTDSELYEKIIENASNELKMKYSLSVVVKKLEKIYQEERL